MGEPLSGRRKSRRPGLQGRWRYVVDSLEAIVPIYETGSSRIAFFSDRVMRRQVTSFAARRGALVLDLGSGPGTMSRIVAQGGATPVLLDASRKMLAAAAPSFERVQAAFEQLPFREGSFDGVVAGFSLRDARDLVTALREVKAVLRKDGGRFSFCDLGKPESAVKATMIAYYLEVVVPLIGLLTGGLRGLRFSSLYGTYLLTLDNGEMVRLLKRYFREVSLTARQLGGSIVVRCSGP